MTSPDPSHAQPGTLARVALAMTAWTERWIPDAFVCALLATVVVVAAALLGTPAGLMDVAGIWGTGFWALIPFTMQMSLVIITGYTFVVFMVLTPVVLLLVGVLGLTLTYPL